MQLPRIAKKKYEKIVKLQHKIGAIEKDFFYRNNRGQSSLIKAYAFNNCNR